MKIDDLQMRYTALKIPRSSQIRRDRGALQPCQESEKGLAEELSWLWCFSLCSRMAMLKLFLEQIPVSQRIILLSKRSLLYKQALLSKRTLLSKRRSTSFSVLESPRRQERPESTFADDESRRHRVETVRLPPEMLSNKHPEWVEHP